MAQLRHIEQEATHRLIPARYDVESVLETLPLPDHVRADLSELDAATNERKIAEAGGNDMIRPEELLFGVPEAHMVNAAFSHPGPHGARFSDSGRGAWYAGFEVETSVAEVGYHKRRFLADSRFHGCETFEYVDFLANFSGAFHTLDAAEKKLYLRPEPVPECYREPQLFARKLLFEGSNGVVYPSVRRASGTCIACFRPALVFYPRRGMRYRLTIDTETDRPSFEAMEFPVKKRSDARVGRAHRR